MPCASDLCLQGHAPCPTPMQCSGAAQLVDESIDHFRLHRLQDVKPRTVYLAPGVLEGPDLEDFLKKDNALSAIALWVIRPLVIGACAGGALYFAGRAAGLF